MKSHVLVVDDDADILNSISRLFYLDSTVTVITASSGYEAMEKMEAEPVQVVISDQRMPGMQGNEFLAEVRKKYPATLRILLSGYSDIDALQDAVNNAGIIQYIKKPWETEELRDIVHNALILADMRYATTGQKQNGRSGEFTENSFALPYKILLISDNTLWNHQVRVAQLARRLAEIVTQSYSPGLFLTSKEMEMIYDVGLLHDIGLMQKPFSGNENTFVDAEEIRTENKNIYWDHTLVGERMVKMIPGKEHVGVYIRSHHESFSGDGYPDGLSGDHIPFISRIIRIISDYDILVSESRKSPGQAIRTMEQYAGLQYDPAIFQFFME